MPQSVRHRRDRHSGHSSRAGFTLVELLVVIGIIALLMSILLPALGRSRERANQVKCASNLRQIAMAMVQYTLDNKGAFPHSARGSGFGPAYAADWVYWQQPNLPTQNPTPFFWPPTDNKPESRPADQSAKNGPIARYLGKTFNNALFTCPSDDVNDRRLAPSMDPDVRATGPNHLKYPYSYTMNDLLSHRLVDFDGNSFRFFGGRAAKASIIRDSARVVMLVEESHRTMNDGDFAPVGISGSAGSWTITPGGGNAAGPDKRNGDWLSVVHDRKARRPDNVIDATRDKGDIPNSAAMGNVAFADGHVDYVTREYVHSRDQKNWSWQRK